MEKLKKCVRCGIEKEVSEFAKHSSNKDGLQSYCKGYANAYAKDYRSANADRLKVNAKSYYIANADRLKAYAKDYNEANKGNYLYLIYRGKQIVYVGSCSYLSKRISNHINCHSNIAEYMREDNWIAIKTLDIADIVNSKEEREFIEYILIQELEPSWNVNSNKSDIYYTEREQDLVSSAMDIIDNLDYYFNVYRENYNSYYYYINESNVGDYAMDISDIVSYYAELEEEDYC